MNERQPGTIKHLDAAKAFGFITGNDGVDRFFHRTDVVGKSGFNELAKGDRVYFTHADGQKGPRAVSVTKG